MTDYSSLVDAFADYARTITGRYEIGDVLYRLTDQVVEILPVDGAGVSLGEGDQLQFVTATDERVVHVEQRQISAGQGPCHDAFTTGQQVVATDLREEHRWPDYVPLALEQGCQAVAGIPMLAADQRIGALNLYSHAPRAWNDDALDIAQILADMASGYIVNARVLSEAARTTQQLQHALESRIIVEQAKGILAERHGVDPATAFDFLRKHARAENTKVHDIARAIVDGTLHL